MIHHPSNLSDHSPVFCQFCVKFFSEDKASINAKPSLNPSWCKSSETEKVNYKNVLNQYLPNVQIPEQILHCQNVYCSNQEHISAIDNLVIGTLNAVDSTAWENLCLNGSGTSPHKKPPIPGWSSLVKPYKEKSIFWHKIWLSARRPLNCQLFDIMKHTRNIYHYHLRKCKKYENSIRRNRLLDACINGGNGDIFDELR